jgi:hypothetical protein
MNGGKSGVRHAIKRRRVYIKCILKVSVIEKKTGMKDLPVLGYVCMRNSIMSEQIVFYKASHLY